MSMPLSPDQLAAALAAVLPPDCIDLDPAAIRAHTVGGIEPLVVVRPADAESVAAVLRAAGELGAAVVPWGAGTQQALGHPPRRADVVLSLARLNQVLRYEPEDLTISAGAGCTAAQLGELLAPHNQFLPLDPPLAERATLGGLVATATYGPRRGLYGWLRDLLIGITFVQADGTVARAGGMVVKNVAGYDLMKLHLGALGTLGVVVAVNLKVLPRPAASGGLAAGFPDLASALAVVDRLAASQLLPGAVNLLGQLPRAGEGDPTLRDVGLSVVVEGTGRAVDRQLEEVAAWCRESGGTGGTGRRANLLAAPAAASALRQAADFPQTATLSPDEAVIRLEVRPGQLGEALAHAAAAVARQRLPGSWLAHAPQGAIFRRLQGVDREGGAVLRALQGDLVARWGNAVILGCAPALKAGLAVWGAEPEGLPLMRTLKTRFDPRGTLNPGRYVGGI